MQVERLKRRGEKDDARGGQREKKRVERRRWEKLRRRLCLPLSKEDNEVSGAELTKCCKFKCVPGKLHKHTLTYF